MLENVLAGTQPADRALDAWFRAHRNMGAQDRGFAAETVYGCLRRRRELEALIAPLQSAAVPQAEWLVAAWLVYFGGWSARALAAAGFAGDPVVLVTCARGFASETQPFAVRANLPDWLAERWRARYGETEALALAAALNEAAPVTLRANTLKIDRHALRARLAEEGHALEPTRFAPHGLWRRARTPLFATQAFREGLFELQDEASQLAALLLAPQPGERVADFCAGAGGKTLALGAQMRNTGALYAFDVSRARLARLRPRLARAGLDNVRVVPLDGLGDKRLKRLRESFDAVFVDVPCSGTGTLRRNPDIKWRSLDLAALRREQEAILATAARLVRPGGRLVYATCSLLEEENEGAMAAFLAAHADFSITPPATVLAEQGVREAERLVERDALILYPHRHGTDGFFAMRCERIGAAPRRRT